MQSLHHEWDNHEMILLELLALTAPPSSPTTSTASASTSTSTSTSSGDTPGTIGESFFTKRVNIHLALLRVPAALFALRSRQAVEEVVLHVNRLHISRSWSSSRRNNLGEFGIRFLEIEFAQLTFESLYSASIRRHVELPVARRTSRSGGLLLLLLRLRLRLPQGIGVRVRLLVPSRPSAAPSTLPPSTLSPSTATSAISTLRTAMVILLLMLGRLRLSGSGFWDSRRDSRSRIISFKHLEVFDVNSLESDEGEHFVA